MRKVVLFYKDPAASVRDEYQTGPYTGDKVEMMKRMLASMGCEQFRTEPFKEVA